MAFTQPTSQIVKFVLMNNNGEISANKFQKNYEIMQNEFCNSSYFFNTHLFSKSNVLYEFLNWERKQKPEFIPAIR